MDTRRKQQCLDWRKGRGIGDVGSPGVKSHDPLVREPESVGVSVELVVDLVIDHAPRVPRLVRVRSV